MARVISKKTRSSKTAKTTKDTTPAPSEHSRMWALLSLVGFLVVYLACVTLGLSGLMPFVYAALCLLSILLIEGLLRGEMWLFDPQFSQTICNPDMPFRLMIFVGSFLLILESVVLLGAAVDPHFDLALSHFLQQKACVEQGVSCS
ncbi:MAG: hypothetical protein WA001_02885 [Patescibacteria group bacterium]